MNENQLTFDEFERDWRKKHRSSIPKRRRVSSFQEFFWIGFWVLVALGAAIFSAAHTIPAAEMTLLRELSDRANLAKTAFIIVELVIFGAAAGRREIDWLKWLLGAALLVALAGNISSSVRAVTLNGGDLLNQFGGVLLAIIAPVTAFAAGEVLHIQLKKRSEKFQEAETNYQEENKELESKINRAFKQYEKESAPIQPVNSANPVNFNNINRNKPSKILQKAVNWLNEHPEHLETESRDLMEHIGASHVTIWKAQQQIKHSQNGHKQG